LEASHHIGGRAYTEEVAPGVYFDLGCHWLHSASLNPYVKVADALGFTYTNEKWSRNIYLQGRPASEEESQDCDTFFRQSQDSLKDAAAAKRDVSVADVIDRSNRWTSLFDYWASLMTSVDSDQVSVVDYTGYRDTGEDWPLKQGYGALIARFASEVPVQLNTAVEEINWNGSNIRLTTRKGVVSAKKTIITVSTGVLGGGDIKFTPPLPIWKQEAISALPVGNHNRICLIYDRDVFGEDHPQGVTVMEDDDVPMGFRIRPFGYDYVVAVTGGRFADWLERAGTEAAADLAKEKLIKAFGSDIAKHIVGCNVTAWRSDPWIKGAYSAAAPGQAHQRQELAKAIDDRVYFAGEAASTEFFATAHGAYLSGIEAANQVADSLSSSG